MGGTIVPITPFNTGTEPRKMHYGDSSFIKRNHNHLKHNENNQNRNHDSLLGLSSFLTLFYNKEELTTSSSKTNENNANNNFNTGNISKTIDKNRASLVDRAIDFHEKRMDIISQLGNLAYDAGEGMMLTAINLEY